MEKAIRFDLEDESTCSVMPARFAHDADVVVVRRVWSIDRTPFCVETSHLAAQLVPDLAADDLVAGQSLYLLLRSRYGHEIVNGHRTIGVAYVSDADARLLDMKSGAPALALRLVVETAEGRPIEYMTSLNNPDLVTFSTEKVQLA